MTARGSRTLTLAWATLAVLAVVAIGAPWLAPSDPRVQHDLARWLWQPPGAAHWLGTDSAARDVLSRLMHGARISLGMAATAMGVSIALGTLVGAVAGAARGPVDALLMRLTDALIAFPRLLLLILVVAGLGAPGPLTVAVLIGATGWMTTGRLVREETRRLLATEHVRGAVALGVPRRRLVLRHLLPGLAPTIAAAAVFSFAGAVPLETGLSFLGLGVQPPVASWGNIIADADSRPLAHWWLVVFPVLAISATVIAANRVGEAVVERARRAVATRGDAGRGAPTGAP